MFVNSTVFLKPIKGLNGATIDFTQANTYSNIDSNDLDTYVGLESEWLTRSIEDIFEEGGLFSGHQEAEYARLGDEFGKYYAKWMAGEALQSAGFYAKPMFPNGPNMMVAAAIAASMTGQVWLAVAITAASTALSVADGTTSWQHAGTQFAVSAAGAVAGTFAGPAGSMLVNVAASGIKYEEGGGIGWSSKQFKNGAKSGVAKFAVQAGMSAICGSSSVGSIISSAGSGLISSGLETGGGWNNFGFDTDNWSQHIMAGVTAGVSAGITSGMSQPGNGELSPGELMRRNMMGQVMNEGIQAAAYHLGGGIGFDEDYNGFNWNAMAPDASKLGSMVGAMAGEYLNKSYADYGRKENSPQVPGGPDPLGTVDTLLSGLWYGMKTAKDFAGTVMGGITKFGEGLINDFGLNDELSAFSGAVGGAYSTAAGYANSFTNFTGGMFAALDAGVSEFADRTGNLFTEGSFATDEQIREIRDAEQRRFSQGMIAYDGDKPIGNGFMQNIEDNPYYNNVDRGEGGFLNGLNSGNGKSPVDVNDPVALQKYLDGKSDSSQTETNTSGSNEDSFFGKIGDWIKDSTVGKFVSDWVIDPVVNAAKGVGSFAKEWIVDPVKSTYNDAKQWLADSALGKFTSKAIDFVGRAIDLGKKTWDDLGRKYPDVQDMLEQNGKTFKENTKDGFGWNNGLTIDRDKMYLNHKTDRPGWPSESDINGDKEKQHRFWWSTRFN